MRLLTVSEKQFITDHRLTMSSGEIGKMLKRSKYAIQRFLRQNNLQPSKEIIEQFRIKGMTGRTSFTTAEDEKITAEYLTKPVKTLAEEMNRSYTGIMGRLKALNLELPLELRQTRKQIGMYHKGQLPINKGKKWNEYMSKEGQENSRKTQFKKGQKSNNKRPLGSIRVNVYGYMEIKTAEPNKWELYHRLMWEETFGPIPKGGIVRFVTKDKMNVHPFNLEMISTKQNMRLNTIHNMPKPLARITQLRGVITRQINKRLKNLKHEK